MKNLVRILVLLFLLSVNNSYAQPSTTCTNPQIICPMDPCDEEFDYGFCPNDNVKCSSSPNRDGSPFKALIPTCVNIIWPSTSPTGSAQFFQPTSEDPGPDPCTPNGTEPDMTGLPSDPTPDELGPSDPGAKDCGTLPSCPEPGADGCTEPDNGNPDDNLSFYAVVNAENGIDYTNDPKDNPDYKTDKGLWDDYQCCLSWTSDDEACVAQNALHQLWLLHDTWLLHDCWVAHNNWLNTPTYTPGPVYTDAGAAGDAQAALDQWVGPTGICGNLKGQTCCLNVYMDDNVNDWALALQQDGDPASTSLTVFPGYTTDLPPGSNCPEQTCPTITNPPDINTQRFIMINMTNIFLYQNDKPDAGPNTDYGSHKVPKMMYFTGGSAPSGLATDYHSISFFTLLEHEIGHYLGMVHPNEGNCNNNNNCCHTNMLVSQNGHEMVMAEGKVNVNLWIDADPLNLQAEDKIMFQKLYCPLKCNADVSDNKNDDTFNPIVYPNPSNGASILSYKVSKLSLVQISLYDVLGREIINIVSEKQEPGNHSVSLLTQYLASGNYICRVTVGQQEASIRVVITK